MVVTFPHMGKAYVPIKALFEDLGVNVVVPPNISKKTLEIGTKLSPEMACLPLKINIGNYIESIENGADTVVLSGSCGPCRFGYYGVIQKEILYDLGYDVDLVILDPPNGDLKSFFQRVRRITGENSWYKIMKAFSNAVKVTEETDKLLGLILKKRCRERYMGETDKLLHEFDKDIQKSRGSREALDVIGKYVGILNQVDEIQGVSPLRIGLVGEIYTLIEPYVNLHIEKKLGNMGVEVYRGITVNDWVKNHLSLDWKHRAKEKIILKKASPYLNLCVGGHAWQTVAHTIQYAEEGVDGVIQVMPFGCMPEIVAKSILPRVSEEKDIPVMTVVVDEMTGEAGYQTRLEAFVDLLRQKWRKDNDKDKKMLSGR